MLKVIFTGTSRMQHLTYLTFTHLEPAIPTDTILAHTITQRLTDRQTETDRQILTFKVRTHTLIIMKKKTKQNKNKNKNRNKNKNKK